MLLIYLLNFLFLGIIYVVFFFQRWWKKGCYPFSIRTIMYVYISFVLMVTLMPFEIMNFIPGGNNLFLESINLEPYRDIRAGYGGAVRESMLNVVMLLPFGFLLPFVGKTSLWKVLGLSFLFSLSIETTQLYFTWSGGLSMRSFDVTDLINNTIGGSLGYAVYLLVSRLNIMREK